VTPEQEAIYAELLALRCRRSDPAAFGEVVHHWEDRLFYFVRGLVKDEEDAWDILQQTWMKAFRGIRGLENGRSLSPWLYRIARFTAMSHLRKAYAEQDVRDAAADVAPADDNAGDAAFEDAERVHRGLKRLPLVHREALTLHFLEGFSVEEIAAVLDIPPGTVKSRLYHAKRALRSIVEEGDNG